jgi:hypothetical protein
MAQFGYFSTKIPEMIEWFLVPLEGTGEKKSLETI